MNKVTTYLKNVYNELVNKTSWPSWNDLFNSAKVVMVASVIIAAIIAIMDFCFETVLEFVYDILA